MAEKWDKQLMDFLKRTGDELKRTTEDLRGEAQRLLKEVKDPQNQTRVKEGLEQLRTWAATTSKVATEKIETAVRQVEGAVERAFKPEEPGQQAEPPKASAAAAPAAAPKPEGRAAKKAAPKSIGRKKAASKAASKGAAKKSASTSKKTIGRAKKPPTAGA